jgi:hypothetical protein
MATTKYITIGEHHVPQAPMPKNRDEILFVNDNKHSAYWRRIEFPKIWFDFIPYDIPRGPRKTRINAAATVYNQHDELVSLSEDDTKLLQRLLRQEIKRRKQGVWMKNYDEYVHLAPGYYFALQWGEMKDFKNPETGTGHGQFRIIQNQLLTLNEYVKWHPSHIGLNVPKCKKSGITQIVSLDVLNEATLNDGIYPMVSKEYDAVTDVNIAYALYAFDLLPRIMQPEVVGRNEHEIKFGLPKNKSRKDDEKYLVSHIVGTKTKATCFDSYVVKRGVIDEPPKMYEASKLQWDSLYKKSLETVRLQQRKNGSLMTISYMPEIDDIGFLQYRSHYMRSRLSTVNESTGTTETMYINFPIPASKSNEMCFDRHGRCDEGKATSLILAERATKKTKSDKQAHKRTNPIDENDMFDSGGKGTAFDNIRIALRKRELDAELQAGKRPWREGHLRWEVAVWEGGFRPKGQFCKVWFEELSQDQLANGEEGTIRIFHDLEDDLLNQVIVQNSRGEDGYLCPVKGATAVGAFDPTDFKLKKDVAEGSLNGAYGGLLDDPALDTRYNKKVTDVPLFEYLYRHDDPTLTTEDLYKIFIYWGMRFIIEANKGWIVTQAKLDKMHHFLLLLQADGTIKPYQEGDENGLVNTTREMINVYCLAISRYIADKKGRGIDFLWLIKTERLLQQLADFDTMDPKRFDGVVSFGWWRVAVESFIQFLLNNVEEDDGGAIEAVVEGMLDF